MVLKGFFNINIEDEEEAIKVDLNYEKITVYEIKLDRLNPFPRDTNKSNFKNDVAIPEEKQENNNMIGKIKMNQNTNNSKNKKMTKFQH